MFKYILPLFFVTFLSFTNLALYAQDSIPVNDKTPIEQTEVVAEPQINIPTANPVNPETPIITNPTEKRINQVPDDAELKAAQKDNPFALIRNGEPRKSKSISMFPSSSKNPNSRNEVIEATQTEEIQEELVLEDVFEPVDTTVIALNAKNPFRLEGSQDDRKQIAKATKIKFNPNAGTGVKNTKEKRELLFDTSKVDVNQSDTLKFTFLTILLGLLAFIVASFRSELIDVYQAFLSQNLMALLHREKETILRFPYLLMYLLSFISVGTSIFLISNLLEIEIFEYQTYSILACIVGVGIFFTSKHLILSILSILFPFKKEINLYSFTIAIFNFIMGIVLLPIIALLSFADDSFHSYVLYIMLFLVGIILIYRIFRALIIGQKYFINNKFHFFMYLCTVEIAPMIILFKFLS